ncbi:hypothetical protein ABT369_09895 [Dactylosporangium sp. NPDC000244]|uniref:hypothetical protein n=1 Tax=Dactylosporangium sp. NPDC000244 TaxID=3154365 RepID=UPI003318D0ED
MNDAGVTSPMDLLAGIDWAALERAYGRADDLPERLAGLLSGDPPAAKGALADLDMCVLHQGSIYSCTAPVALFVAATLGDDRTGIALDDGCDEVRPLRAALLEWLGQVGESAAYCDDIAAPEQEERACQQVRAELYRAVAPLVADPIMSTRIDAVRAAGQLLRAPDLVDERQDLARRLEIMPAAEAVERAHQAFALDWCGVAPRPLLFDPDPRVRAYAAVARTLDGDSRALTEVRAALREPDAVHEWFADEDDPQRSGWFLHTLVQALLRRTSTFGDVESEAITIVEAPTTSYARLHCINALLPRACPGGVPHSPAALRLSEAIDRPAKR